MKHKSRREFITTTVAGAVALGVTGSSPSLFASPRSAEALAILGGMPVRTVPFPDWPIIAENDEKNWHDVLRHKQWCRVGAKPSNAIQFEETWKSMTGAKYCLATPSGTTALFTSLNALDVSPGDEVLVPAYTFVASYSAIFFTGATPVLCEIDAKHIKVF